MGLKEGEHEVSMNEIDFIDFTDINVDMAGASEGYTISKLSLPVSNYDGLTMSIGVPSDLNENLPSDFSSSHPLARSSEHWSQWNSYIFSKLEGKYDEDNEPTQLEGNYVFHIGRDEMFRTIELDDLDIALKPDSGTRITVEIDVKNLFRLSNGSYLDLETQNEIHGDESGEALSLQISNNWLTAISIQ